MNRPDFNLQRIPHSASGAPGIYPVLANPVEARVNRRTFLGSCFALTTALATADTLTLGPHAHAQPSPTPGGIAGTWINPELLSMVGIEAAADESIEEGYHLRWFANLQYPRDAFPNSPEIQPYLDSEDRPILAIDDQHRITGVASSDGLNHVIPPAFHIYRRPHYETCPENFRVDRSLLTRLRFSSVQEPASGIRIARETTSRREYYERVPHNEWERRKAVPESVISGAGNRTAEVITIWFLEGDSGLDRDRRRDPGSQSPGSIDPVAPNLQVQWPNIALARSVLPLQRNPRAVHCLRVTARHRAASYPPPTLLLGYADSLSEPVREHWLNWQRSAGGGWVAEARFNEGHYHWIKLISPDRQAFDIEYGFMDQDLTVAADPEDPQPGEWVLVKSIPFITRFQNWSAAKTELFQHAMRSRFLDFAKPGNNGWESRLDYKYRDLFNELQDMFLRMRLCFEHPYIHIAQRADLLDAKFEAKLFHQLWSMDPIIASLYNQRYVDAPGAHNEHPPSPGTTYDYLISTAWQPPAQRLCYIAQNVSKSNTPPVPKPSGVVATQADGMSFGMTSDGQEERLYRTMVSWPAPQAPHAESDSHFEPASYDVARGETETELKSLTLYVEPEESPGRRVVDTPIRQAESEPEPDESELSMAAFHRLALGRQGQDSDRESGANNGGGQMSGIQRDSLRIQRTLHEGRSTAEITVAQVAAQREMQAFAFGDIFPGTDPPVEFTDWLPLPDDTRQRSHWYDVRSIDIFGRTSAWLGPRRVTLVHNTEPPEPTNVSASIELDTDGNEALRVSWRLGPEQIKSGAPIDHFNVMWREYSAEFAKNDQSRRLAEWISNTVVPAVGFQQPVPATLITVNDIVGQSISGNIEAASVATGVDAVSREVELLERAGYAPPSGGTATPRIVTLSTNQCLGAVPPFIDLPSRYRDGDGLFDGLALQIAGNDVPVVGISAGLHLKVKAVLTVDVNAPDPFSSLIGQEFVLEFSEFKQEIQWNQTMSESALPDLEYIEIPWFGRGTSVAAAVAKLQARREVSLLISDPLSLEITGRQDWLTNEAWMEYSYPNNAAGRSRVPINDFGLISISNDTLTFGEIPIRQSVIKTLFVTNGTNSAVTVDAIEKSGDMFLVSPTRDDLTIAANSTLTIRVTFVPEGPVGTNIQGNISIRIAGRTFEVGLDGVVVAEDAQLLLGQNDGPERHFIGELLLGTVVLDLPPEAELDNPNPVFPDALLESVLNGNNDPLQLKILKMPIRKITASVDPGNLESITNSCFGDVYFTDSNQLQSNLVSSRAVSRPRSSGASNSVVSFLAQPSLNLPFAPAWPRAAEDVRYFLDYRVEKRLSEIPNLSSSEVPEKISVAISSHKYPADEGYASENERQVTPPLQARLTLPRPGRPPVPPITCGQEPWTELFEVRYPTMPKVSDVKKVVRFKLELNDPAILPDPASALEGVDEIEILRAPEDAIRLILVNPPMKSAGSVGPSGCPDSRDPYPDEWNQLSETDRYRLVAERLVNTWDDPIFSPQSAFRSVGRISDLAAIDYVDEIDGVAPGNVFYAIRFVRGQSGPGPASLLPIRVKVPDSVRPRPPTVTRIVRKPSSTHVQWLPAAGANIVAYEIWRTDNRTQPIAYLYAKTAETPAGGESVKHAPLYLESLERDFTVRNNAVDLGFPLSAYDIPDFDRIVGLYLADDGVPATIVDPAYDFETDERNFWPRLTSASLNADEKTITGISLADPGSGTEIFSDGTQIVLIVARSTGNSRIEESTFRVEIQGVPRDKLSQIDRIYPLNVADPENLWPSDPIRIRWGEETARGQILHIRPNSTALDAIHEFPAPIAVHYGESPAEISPGQAEFLWVDDDEDLDDSNYRVVAVKKIVYGPGELESTLVRSR